MKFQYFNISLIKYKWHLWYVRKMHLNLATPLMGENTPTLAHGLRI